MDIEGRHATPQTLQRKSSLCRSQDSGFARLQKGEGRNQIRNGRDSRRVMRPRGDILLSRPLREEVQLYGISCTFPKNIASIERGPQVCQRSGVSSGGKASIFLRSKGRRNVEAGYEVGLRLRWVAFLCTHQ